MSIFSGIATKRGTRNAGRFGAAPIISSAVPVSGSQGPAAPAPPPTLSIGPSPVREVMVPHYEDAELQTRELQAAADAGGTVRLAANTTYRLTAPLEITGDTTIIGAVDPDGSVTTLLSPDPVADRFEGIVIVAGGARLTMLLIVLSHGHRYGLVNNGRAVLRSSVVQRTSGGWDPAGIRNAASAELRLAAFSSSSENDGHGIINHGRLLAQSARITLNTTPMNGQGGFDGGGIFAAAGSTTTLTAGTDVWLNTARNGGGVFLDQGAVTDIDLANFQLNNARWRGGALLVEAGTWAKVSNCVFAANTAGGDPRRPGYVPGIGNNAGALRISDSIIADAPGVVTEHGGRTTLTGCG